MCVCLRVFLFQVSKLCIGGMESRSDLGLLGWTMDLARRAASRYSYSTFRAAMQPHWSSRSIVALDDVSRDWEGIAWK